MGQKQGWSRRERYSTLWATCAVPSPLAPSYSASSRVVPFFFSRKGTQAGGPPRNNNITCEMAPHQEQSELFIIRQAEVCLSLPIGFSGNLTCKALSFSYTYRCSPSLLRDTSFPFQACHSFSLLAFLIILISSFLLFSLLPVCFPLVPLPTS